MANMHKTAILDWKVTGEDYSMGFDISISNLNEKTIRYIYITVTATSPVHDKIGTKTVRAIGPIKNGDHGSYNFEHTFYSSAARHLSLDTIKIQYMDWEEEGNRTMD